MTEEHLPPKSSGNKANFKRATFQDWMKADDLIMTPGSPLVQGGVRGFMLCKECNNFTGRWAREYRDWAAAIASILGQLPMSPGELAEQPGFATIPKCELRDVYPGRFVRQALSMMMTVSGSNELAGRYPVIKELALGGPPSPLPGGMRLFFGICAGPNARFFGGPLGTPRFDTNRESWTWVLEAALPPIGIQLVTEGDAAYGFGLDISSFTEMSVDSTMTLVVDALQVGFTFSPYPSDYRSAAQMRLEESQVQE